MRSVDEVERLVDPVALHEAELDHDVETHHGEDVPPSSLRTVAGGWGIAGEVLGRALPRGTRTEGPSTPTSWRGAGSVRPTRTRRGTSTSVEVWTTLSGHRASGRGGSVSGSGGRRVGMSGVSVGSFGVSEGVGGLGCRGCREVRGGDRGDGVRGVGVTGVGGTGVSGVSGRRWG